MVVVIPYFATGKTEMPYDWEADLSQVTQLICRKTQDWTQVPNELSVKSSFWSTGIFSQKSNHL